MAKLDIEIANEVLLNNISKIRTVTEWAALMGYELSEFSRKYRNEFNIVAVKAQTMLRIIQIEKHIKKGDTLLNYELARLVGLRDEKDLYNFMCYHMNCSPTQFRKKIKTRKITKTNLGKPA